MKKINSVLVILVIPIVMSALIFCDCNKAAAKPIKLSFAALSVKGHAVMKDALTPWAEELERATDGKLDITIFYAHSLVGPAETYDAAVKGTADIAYALPEMTPGRFPVTMVGQLPFLYDDAETGSSLIWHLYNKFPDLQKEWKDTKMLGLWTVPPSKVHTIKEIHTADDLKGMIIRGGGRLAARIIELVGATPVDIPGPDLYSSLERGTIDGAFLPFESFVANRYYEIVKYSFSNGIFSAPMFCVMHRDTWNKLPADIQQIIEGLSGASLSARCGRALNNYETQALEKVKAQGGQVYEFPPSEMDKIRGLVKPMYNEWVSDMEARGVPGRAILDAAVSFSKQQK
jgi:TRAP-type C4-dicarboxylate transport system substrate-binding protein